MGAVPPSRAASINQRPGLLVWEAVELIRALSSALSGMVLRSK